MHFYAIKQISILLLLLKCSNFPLCTNTIIYLPKYSIVGYLNCSLSHECYLLNRTVLRVVVDQNFAYIYYNYHNGLEWSGSMSFLW